MWTSESLALGPWEPGVEMISATAQWHQEGGTPVTAISTCTPQTGNLGHSHLK